MVSCPPSLRPSALALASLLLVTPGAAAANQVLVVEDDGGGDFTDLAAAVAAAGDGDILLVKGGSYSNVVVDDKSLVLIGEDHGGETPDLYSVTVRNLSASKRVVVRGFRIDAFVVDPVAMRVEQNDGPVVIEECIFPTAFATHALAVEGSDAVFVVRSELNGLDGVPGLAFPSTLATGAMTAKASHVVVHESVVVGGDGAPGTSSPFLGPLKGLAGAPAIDVEGGSVHLSGGTVKGGDGGANLDVSGSCVGAGPGAAAVRLTGGALLRRLDVALVGGAGGASDASCPGGTDGSDVAVVAGAVEVIPEIARSLEVTGLVREGQAATVSIRGVAGDVVAILYGFQTAGPYVPGLQGALLVGFPPLVVAIGPLPTSEVSIPVTIPANQVVLPAEGFSLFAQPLVAGQTGLGLLGAPSALTIVDSTL